MNTASLNMDIKGFYRYLQQASPNW